MGALRNVIDLIVFTFTIFNSSLVALKPVDESPLTAESSCYCLRQIIGQLKNPISVIFYVDGAKERLLVVEQRGVVSRYETDGSRIDTFLDIRDRVVISEVLGESRGLLSFVLDPIYDVTKNVYVYYIRKDDGKDYAYVSVFNAKSGVVDPKSEKFLLRIYQPYVHRNGGPMLFGDDGYLYIMTGDGGEEDDPQGKAQNLTTLYGKVLRLDVRTQGFSEGESEIAMMYSVPSTNPFMNITNARKEVFAFGIRNMWGCSQDSAEKPKGTGRIFCAETGANKFDEINIIESGRNYGWSLKEGSECRKAGGCTQIENEGQPIYEFTHTSDHALVGGYVYRGQALRHMADADYYIYGDVISGKTYFLEEPKSKSGNWASYKWNICESTKCAPNAREHRLKKLLAFGQDQTGELYLLMTDDLLPELDSGKILKLVPPNSSATSVGPCTILLVGYATLMAATRYFI